MIAHSPGWQRLAQAAAFAFLAHQDQARKGTGAPYLSHLLSVSALILENGGDEEQAIAGLLHDVIEDCGAAYRPKIAQAFGTRVAALVEACTDTDVLPKPPWKARKEAYLKHLETVDLDAVLVSACDKLHNIRSILMDQKATGNEIFKRFSASKHETLWYYESLVVIFNRRLPNTLLAREIADQFQEVVRRAK